MKRREFLQAGVGAVVAGSLLLGGENAKADAPPNDGLLLGEHGPIYQVASTPALSLTNAVTLEAWVKADPMPQGGGRILDKLAPGTNNSFTLDTYPGNALRLIVGSGQCSYDAHLSADRWTHVVGVYSVSQKIMALYMGGEEVARVRDGSFGPIGVTSLPLRIGADSNGDNRFHGHILRAAIYGRALTGPEIAQRAAQPAGQAVSLPGVLGEWKFGGNMGSIIKPVAGTLTLHLLGSMEGSVNIQGEMPAPKEPLALWYRRPAQEWLEALPIGNGRLAAMVFGGVDVERLQLNEGTVWAGGPYTPANPQALAALPEIRRLVAAEKWGEAQALVDAHFLGIPAPELQYQTVGSLMLSFPAQDTVSHYRRELDLNTAISRVEYMAGDVRHVREVFASAPDQVIVMRLTADRPGQVSFTAAYDSPQRTSTAARGADTLALDGINGDAQGIAGAVKFQALVRALPEGGHVHVSGGILTVTGADAVTLLISIGTSYKNYRDVGGDAAGRALGPLASAARKPYAALHGAHIADYQRLFHQVHIDLGQSQAMKLPTSERVAAFQHGGDTHLAALHFQYGRYLLLSCSRPGGQPATLQGLWNESLSPPWGSKYTVNINTEMNYWPTAPANLLECYDPLFAMLADLSEAGQTTAKVQYGAGGWVCHHNTDGWRGTAPVDFSLSGMWPTGGAWLCRSFWDHYEFTGDRERLRRHYPLMKEAAQFFLDTLVEEPTHHWLVTSPSVSPENSHPGGYICMGPAMDMQILRDLFDACAEASVILGVDADFRARVAAARARLAPMQIGHLGQLQEWLKDWDAEAPDQHHRHVSHLYGLFPSNQITRRGTPLLFAAAQKSLELRGDESTGWAMAWRINLWARLEDGDHAYKLVQLLLSPERTAPNLFDLHPPFQIDGNFGYVSGVCEMLLQSHAGELHLLPALPSAWPSGSVKGLRARGGFEVAMAWQDGRLTQASVFSHNGSPCKVRAGGQVREFPTERGKHYTLNAALRQI